MVSSSDFLLRVEEVGSFSVGENPPSPLPRARAEVTPRSSTFFAVKTSRYYIKIDMVSGLGGISVVNVISSPEIIISVSGNYLDNPYGCDTKKPSSPEASILPRVIYTSNIPDPSDMLETWKVYKLTHVYELL
jgi:hypothetical protein